MKRWEEERVEEERVEEERVEEERVEEERVEEERVEEERVEEERATIETGDPWIWIQQTNMKHSLVDNLRRLVRKVCQTTITRSRLRDHIDPI
jgi:hypothetical protein